MHTNTTMCTLIQSLRRRRRRIHQNGRDANAAKLRLSIDVSPSVDAFHVRIRDDYADFVTIAPIKWIGDDRRVMKMNARSTGLYFFQFREAFAVARGFRDG